MAAISLQLVGELVALERGQPLQADVEDRLGLLLGEPVAVGRDLAVGGDLAVLVRGLDQLDQRQDVGQRPRPRHQAGLGLLRVGGGTDQRDDLVDVGDGDDQAHDDVRAAAGLGEVEGGAAEDDLLAEGDERLQHLLEAQLLGPAAAQARPC